jgi:membrane-associated phospholipid phosphatase
MRLSPRSCLGLHLAVGLFLCSVFLWIFGSITSGVVTSDFIVAVDARVNDRVLHFRSPFATAFMANATRLGGALFVVTASFLVGAWLITRRHAAEAAGFVAAVLGGELLVFMLKIMVHRPRPPTAFALVHAWGWSFPSGHAVMAVTLYGMAAYLLVKRADSWRGRALVVAFACLIAFVIGLSRIYLQAHYLSDVLAGFAAGMFWLTACITGLEVYELKKRASSGQP